MIQGNDTGNLDSHLLLYLLYGGKFTLPAFLPVQRNDHPGRRGTGSMDQFDGFPDGGSGGNDIVHDQYLPLQRCAHHAAPLAMVLGLLAIEAPGQITVMLIRQGDAGSSNEGNPLVGGTEQDVDVPTGIFDRLGVEAAKPCQLAAGVEQAGVEEIGAHASGFQGERSESQNTDLDGKIKEFMLVVFHNKGLYMRIITLNANGIRSAANKGLFSWMSRQRADVICLQEIRAQEDQLTDRVFRPRTWHAYFHDARKKGYSGVAIYSRRKPDKIIRGIGWPDVDAEGRYIEAQFGPLSVISLYLPSGSSSEERQAFKFEFLERFMPYLRRLRLKRRQYVLCGDWNIAHKKVDIRNWRSNQKNSGFLPEERAWMDELFGSAGYVDAFRKVNQQEHEYTWWSNRGKAWENNVGWRIDYQVVTPKLAETVQAASIYRDKRFSDHAPLIIDYGYQL